MGKVVKQIIVPVLIVVATVYTGGFFGLVGGGATGLAGLSAATGAALSAGLATAISTGLSLAAASFASKPDTDMRDSQARLSSRTNVNAFGKWVFGKTPGSLDVVFADKSNDETLVTQVIHVASHRIHKFLELWVTDEKAVNDDDTSAGLPWHDLVYRFENLGSETQSAINPPTQTNWPATAEGRGIAHMLVQWNFAPGDKRLKSGIPTRLTQIVQGAPVYDPRLDTTVGGSGSHRADDNTTWEYVNGGVDIGENAALIFLFYLLGWHSNGKLVFGVGESPSNIDMDSFIAMANVAELTVDGEKKYPLGGVIRTDQDHERIIGQLESATGGKLGRVGGRWYLWLPHDDLVSVGRIEEKHFISDAGTNFIPAGPIEDLYNTARGRFIDPDNLYQASEYPEVVESAAVTEDGRSRVLSKDFALIQDAGVAQRMAREQVRRSRFTGAWQFATGPMGLDFRPFDVITINSRDTNYEDQLVRIIEMSFSPFGIVEFEVMEEDSSIYDVSDPLGTPVTQNDPDTLRPESEYSVINLDATASSISGSGGTASDAFTVTWDDPTGFVKRTEVQFRVSTDALWTEIPSRAIGFNDAVIQPVEPGTEYDIRARHISNFDVEGAWSSVTRTAGRTQTTLADIGTNNLINPGFEAGDRGWTPSNSEWSIVNDPANARAGQYCAKITAGVTGFMANNSTLQVEPGDRLLAQGFMKRTAGNAGSHLRCLIRFLDDAGSQISVISSNQVTSSTYEQVRVLGVAPSNAVKADFIFDSQGGDGSTLEGFADGAYMLIVPKNLDINSLQTTNAPRDANATDNSSIIDAGVTQEQSSGGTTRRLPIGAGSVAVSDGDSVTFAQDRDEAPLIIFGPGASYSAILGSGVDQYQSFIATNISTSGFDAVLKIKNTAASNTETDGDGSGTENPWGSGHGNPDWRAGKEDSAEATDDTYTFRVDLTTPRDFTNQWGITIQGSITLGFYTYDGTGWVQRKTATWGNGSAGGQVSFTNQDVDVTQDGLTTQADGNGDTYGVHVEQQVGDGSGTLDDVQNVKWIKSTGASEVSATAGSLPKVTAFVLGKTEIV